MVISHGQGVGIADIDFVLPRSSLSLRKFDWDTGSANAVSDRANYVFITDSRILTVHLGEKND